ncbi:hypothetical protein [Pseudoalteromonas piscicida]|uniref:hypothetical protein n=1 Tax=Pseudoalteromonas piscicida TaxID=43662 RepID=UPI0030B0124A
MKRLKASAGFTVGVIVIGKSFVVYSAYADEGRVLVLLFSERTLLLANGEIIETEYYLNEFGALAKSLADAYHKLVLASPRGNVAGVDQKSLSVNYFDSDEEQFQSIKKFIASLPDINDTASFSECGPRKI